MLFLFGLRFIVFFHIHNFIFQILNISLFLFTVLSFQFIMCTIEFKNSFHIFSKLLKFTINLILLWRRAPGVRRHGSTLTSCPLKPTSFTTVSARMRSQSANKVKRGESRDEDTVYYQRLAPVFEVIQTRTQEEQHAAPSRFNKTITAQSTHPDTDKRSWILQSETVSWHLKC